jgi:LacI family transcriptional regulator
MLDKPATLRDVAELAGVHPSTASRALNAGTRDMVNPSTVTRVLDVARELQYRPNSLARGLKMSRTFTVGMLVPDLTNPLFPPIVRGIEDCLTGEGYTLILSNTDNRDDKERSILAAMGTRRVDGMLLATARRDYPLLEDILEAGTPVVLVNRSVDRPAVPSVTGDDHAGIGLAVRHLVELGHRRIAHVGGTQTVSTGLARYRSFLSSMQQAGLVPDPDLVVFADWFQEESGAVAFRTLVDRGIEFTAVVAANDLIALGCYDVARERGIRVPQDLSVVGYNGIPFSDKFDPPLTTVRIPHYEIGVRAADLLLECMRDPSAAPAALRLRPDLVIRASTAPPRS